MKKPYLVQRCTILRPLNKYKGERFSDAVSLDYMGSSEFEWGAPRKSLRAIQANKDNYKITVIKNFAGVGENLRVFHSFNDKEFEQYEEYLRLMKDGKLEQHLKERSKFDQASINSNKEKGWSIINCDLWWDIENHVMWSYDKNFMARLVSHLEESWLMMDEANKRFC